MNAGPRGKRRAGPIFILLAPYNDPDDDQRGCHMRVHTDQAHMTPSKPRTAAVALVLAFVVALACLVGALSQARAYGAEPVGDEAETFAASVEALLDVSAAAGVFDGDAAIEVAGGSAESAGEQQGSTPAEQESAPAEPADEVVPHDADASQAGVYVGQDDAADQDAGSGQDAGSIVSGEPVDQIFPEDAAGEEPTSDTAAPMDRALGEESASIDVTPADGTAAPVAQDPVADPEAPQDDDDLAYGEVLYEPWNDFTRIDTNPYGAGGGFRVSAALLADAPTADSTSEERIAYAEQVLLDAMYAFEAGGTFDKAVGLTVSEFDTAFKNAYYGHAELYYVSPRCGYNYSTSTGVVSRFTIHYIVAAEELPAYTAQLEAAIDAAVALVAPEATDVEKVRAMHDLLVDTVVYTKAAASGYTGYAADSVYTAYGALVNGKAVCQGYSNAMKLLLNRLGIPCVFVPSQPMNHAWNMVFVAGGWYHLDATWDDTANAGNRYRYFLKTDAQFESLSHYGWVSAYQSTTELDLLACCDVVFEDSLPYTGLAIEPPVTVSLWGTALAQDSDFSVSYGSNVEVGTAAITLTGLGAYAAWARQESFEIVALNIGAATLAGIPDQTYTGFAIEPAVTLTLDGVELSKGTDYVVSYASNVDAGAATVTVTGAGHYAGKATAGFTIVPASLAGAQVAPISSQTYTGAAIEPAVTVTLGGVKLAQGSHYAVAYASNKGLGTATVTITGLGNYAGTLTATFEIVAGRQEMYRLYNPYSGEHFYTSSTAERANLVTMGWRYEGVGWVAPNISNTPVYRLYNPYSGDHHYTTSAGERDSLAKIGWSDEGIGWYSDDAKSVSVYRQFNPYVTIGTHNYTTSKKENDALKKVGWKAEGVAWYGLAA